MENARLESSQETTGAQKPWAKMGLGQKLLIGFASLFMLYHVLYITDVLALYMNVIIPIPQHSGMHLAAILLIVFLFVRASRRSKSNKPPFYDIALALVGVGIPLYYALFFREITERVGAPGVAYGAYGLVLALLLIEASRRMLGIAFVCVISFFALLPLISGYLPGILYSPSISPNRWGEFMYATYSGIFGTPLTISARIVVAYLLFSQLLIHSGAGEFFMKIAYAGFGKVRGGPAKMAIVASGFFGMLSGSPAGNVAATGVFTIPLMKKTGYQPHYAGAVECVASLGGMLMPPVMGAVIFILADFIEMSYIEVCYRAFIPACFYYIALFVMVDQEAVRLKLRGLSGETVPPVWRTLKQGFWYAIPVIVLLYTMAELHHPPEKAAIWALLALFLLGLHSKKTRLGPRKLALASEQTLRSVLQVSVACAAAGIVIASISITGIAVNISRELVEISRGSVPILLGLAAVVSFIMGMGVGIIACYIFLAITIAPALTMAGVPLIASHLFMFYWAMLSFITPPVAVLAFVTSAFADAPPSKIGWQACRLGVVAYILPFAWVADPALLAIGTPLEITLAVVKMLIVVFGLALAVGGYFRGKLNWLQRLFILAGSLTLAFTASMPLIGGGIALMGIGILWQWLRSRRGALPPTPGDAIS